MEDAGDRDVWGERADEIGRDAAFRVALWEAINAYAAACGGDPSGRVYGNTRRQAAVAEVERVVRDRLAALSESLSGQVGS